MLPPRAYREAKLSLTEDGALGKDGEEEDGEARGIGKTMARAQIKLYLSQEIMGRQANVYGATWR